MKTRWQSILWVVASCSCVFSGPTSRPDPQAKDRLAGIADQPESRGGIYSQAWTRDRFNYRDPLKRAIEGDVDALASLFKYAFTGTLLGEGAMSQMDVLQGLLRSWGDKPYADVLGKQTLGVRETVWGLLNESWGPEGRWPEGQFPITHSLRKSAYKTYIKFPELEQDFVPDAETAAASKKMDMPDIASTLPLFSEISPARRHDWIDRDGIVEQSDQTIQYRSDGSNPAPFIALLRMTDPIQIEVTFPGSNSSTSYRFERAASGWNRLNKSRAGL